MFLFGSSLLSPPHLPRSSHGNSALSHFLPLTTIFFSLSFSIYSLLVCHPLFFVFAAVVLRLCRRCNFVTAVMLRCAILSPPWPLLLHLRVATAVHLCVATATPSWLAELLHISQLWFLMVFFFQQILSNYFNNYLSDCFLKHVRLWIPFIHAKLLSNCLYLDCGFSRLLAYVFWTILKTYMGYCFVLIWKQNRVN